MVSQDELLRIVGAIYDAGGDAVLWPSVMARISNALDGAAACLIVHDVTDASGGVAASVRIDPEALQLYATHYVREDPWVYRAYRTGRLKPGIVLRGTELLPQSEFDKTAYRNEFAAPYGITRFLGGALVVDGSVSSSLSLLRDTTDFTDDDVAFVKELMPHLSRAIQFHQRVARAEESARAAGEVFERLPVGVILLTEQSRPVFVNAAARRILEQQDGLSLNPAGLGAALRSETTTLRQRVQSALSPPAVDTPRGGAVAISRPSHKRAFEVFVTPLAPAVAGMIGTSEARAAVFVSDPEVSVVANAAVLNQLYGLTTTEARVACALAEGLSLPEVADANGMTPNTARWHAKHVFAKTGTAGQSELVRLLSRGPASLKPSDR